MAKKPTRLNAKTLSKKKKQSFSLSLFLLLFVLASLAAILIFSASIQKILQDKLTPQAGCSCGDPQKISGLFDPHDFSAIWLNESVTALSQETSLSLEAQALVQSQILGETNDEKWIEVDLSQQRARAHQGNKIIYDFPLSSGKFAPTPTGEFRIWYKVKYTKMEGGVKGTGTYYYLPNVPYTMYFYQDYGLHGTYWHNNFGHPMSHGCVNLSIPNAEKLFYWADPILPPGKSVVMSSNTNPGTRVIIHGRTPRG